MSLLRSLSGPDWSGETGGQLDGFRSGMRAMAPPGVSRFPTFTWSYAEPTASTATTESFESDNQIYERLQTGDFRPRRDSDLLVVPVDVVV